MAPLVTFKVLHNRIGVITLNHPKSLNALTFTMGYEFKNLILRLNHELTSPPTEVDAIVHETSPPFPNLSPDTVPLPENTKDINALILTGSGRAFSAGGSLPFLYSRTSTPPHINSSTMYNFYTNFLSLRGLPVPTISAINGPAIGAGACVTLATDYRITKPSTKIGFNFTKLGIHPGMGGSHYLPRLIGHGPASRVLLSGATYSGDEAKELGIVDDLIDVDTDEAFMSSAIDIASSFSSNSPVATRGVTRTLRMSMDEGLEASLRREADQQALNYAREDWKEGLDAVVEKRGPQFSPYFNK
mmetsp:Transcript_1246/g.2112  ORF Transcript_1246/g.2112 Transcript_1246/m.2112 type:complete len:302 (+) Transcript_1246:30-935(+)